ncbi:hypothetical protein KP509_36G060000 [Ceratopteris richardii]|nr:hypothetical protein KP509_36G060000 [Ceratopteris richardii]
MKSEGFSPDGLAYASILKACGYKGAAQKGKRIHAGIVEEDPLRNGRGVSAALVEMYANGGALAMAQKIFNALPVRDVVSWTVLIGGYYQYGHVHEALKCYDQMKREGLFPDMIAFASILKACGSVGAINKGKQVHADLVRHGFLEGVGVLGCALVDMYAKCGMFGKAHVVLSELSNHDVVPWTALIAGYVQHDRGNDAFDFYQKMQQEGLLPNAVTFACLLKACGSLGTEDKGKEVHAEIARRGLLGKIVELGNSLVDMYAKCGAVAKAQEVFDKLILRNTASWNALITGYSCNGYGNKALNCFKQLKLEGLCPDAVTFICILKACGSMGTAGKGQTYFDKMSSSYGIIPSFMHCSCLVNLFCYWGRFGDAMTLLMKVPFSDHSAVWTTLLSSCRKRGNMKLARLVFDHVM